MMSEEYIPFPEEYDRRKLNALYREIPLKDTTSRMLRKYFNAMANLYGIIPLSKAWEIIHSQCPRMITEDEFLAFAEIARHECECFCILGEDELYTDVKSVKPFQREIIDMWLFETEEDTYYITKENQQGKPYYIPEKQELLSYADPYYHESTPEREKLTEFCAKKLKMNEREIAIAFLEFNDKIRYLDTAPNAWLPDWERSGISFTSEKQREDFIMLYKDAFNNGRMQCNRGFTPEEICALLPPKQSAPKTITFGPGIRKALANGTINAAQMREHIPSIDLPGADVRLDMLWEIAKIKNANQPKKVSRNAPCPCGSGKKYKRCCGKN